ncbi:uncharacterized protein LOC115328118 [Ixodes scapularis]|uniref:uncharacterized protein LOC115328118 n=1 Tax=Ixodes scapularis TaxID=6945 RepID=UPI001AD65C79|nr:uncharacterized protein LOC115328118 [Ixodes scapularis]
MQIVDILAYIGDHNDEREAPHRRRCLVEGEAVLNAKHLMRCGIVSRDDAGVKLFALSVQTSQVKAKLHTIDVNLSEKINAKCSCKAGLSGTCKHAVAALLFINRTGIDNLEGLSSTDSTQCWGRHHTAKLYEPRKLSELCHVKLQKQPSLLNDLLEEVRLELINAAPQSALARHSRGRATKNCQTARVITDHKND